MGWARMQGACKGGRQGRCVEPAEPDTLVEIGEYLQVVQETHDYIKDLVPELVPEQP